MVTDGRRGWVWLAWGGLVVAGMVGLAGCQSQSLGGVSELCDNGVDDDDDGWVDCGDPDCTESAHCTTEQLCGDGVATGAEECDGLDVRDRTCADLHPGMEGDLLCSADCTVNDTACTYGPPPCGNGIVEFGEECDCGSVPQSLPATCTAINGAPNSECSTICTWSHGSCESELWDLCDPLTADACCPDDWNATTVCTSLGRGGEFYCVRGCNTTSDCYWSNECWAQLGGICYPSVCGPGYPSDTVNGFCEVFGGGSGWCAPIYDRDTPDAVQYGICIESGSLQHGDSCEPSEGMMSADRSVPACELGLCLQTQDPSVGLCRQLCDWEAAYDAAIYGLSGEVLPCPTGANCLAYARLDATTNVRTGDLAYCIEQGVMNHPHSATTCSIITGQLLADPATTCADSVPGGRCHMIQLASGEMSNGTLIGVCSATQAANRAVWELCDPTTDLCPQGANCRPQDLFAANPAGPTRCLPLCDARMHTSPGECAALGAGEPTAVCRSLSEKLAPTDISPTRLGLCAMP